MRAALTRMIEVENTTKVTTIEKILDIAEVEITQFTNFYELIIRFVIHAGILLFLIHFLYGKSGKRKDFYFSFFAIGLTIFLLCFLLESVKLELGFALGLFAIFGILRYRTDAIPIKEMTYLFVVIGMSVMNALTDTNAGYTQMIFTNTMLVVTLWVLEKALIFRQERSLKILYEKIDNIHTNQEADLLEDIEHRTGIKVKRYEVENIDFLKDVANITIFYEVKSKLFAKHSSIKLNEKKVNNHHKSIVYENQ